METGFETVPIDDGGGGEDDDMWRLYDEIKAGFDNHPVPDTDTGAGAAVCVNPACDGTDFPLDDGNYMCSKCGTLQDRYIDHTAEWRYYGNEDSKSADPTRCGMPTSECLPGMSLGSVISMEGRLNKYTYRLARYQKYNSITYKERTLYNIIDSMSLKAINGGITNSIIEEAKMMYKRLSELKLSRGNNREGLIASSIYMSCKKNAVPRSAKEIAKMFNLDVTVMTEGRKKFDDIMGIHVKSTTPEDFIQRFCSKLGFSYEMVEACLTVVKRQEHYALISENSPPSIAAGCIYLVVVCFDLGCSRKEISVACDISEITISKCFKKLYDYRIFLLGLEGVVQPTGPNKKAAVKRKPKKIAAA